MGNEDFGARALLINFDLHIGECFDWVKSRFIKFSCMCFEYDNIHGSAIVFSHFLFLPQSQLLGLIFKFWGIVV